MRELEVNGQSTGEREASIREELDEAKREVCAYKDKAYVAHQEQMDLEDGIKAESQKRKAAEAREAELQLEIQKVRALLSSFEGKEVTTVPMEEFEACLTEQGKLQIEVQGMREELAKMRIAHRKELDAAQKSCKKAASRTLDWPTDGPLLRQTAPPGKSGTETAPTKSRKMPKKKAKTAQRLQELRRLLHSRPEMRLQSGRVTRVLRLAKRRTCSEVA